VRIRLLRLLACGASVLACAGPAREAKPPAPPPEAEVAAPEPAPSPERQRFELWKQTAVAGDPRADFARSAEAEAERRRSDALAAEAKPLPHRVEEEMAEDTLRERAFLLERLAALGAWIGSGCFPEEPDLSGQDDWIRHRKLGREDFRETEPTDLKPVVDLGDDARVEAYVAITLSCVIRVKLEQAGPDRYEAALDEVRYFALMSRHASWWNPDAPSSPEWILRHEQLHFDLAELFARELGLETERLQQALRGVGADPAEAVADFQRRWAGRMERAQRDLEEIEIRYERETSHGTDVARQTEWFARVKRGLGAVRAGVNAAPVGDR
jgi:hypothetical protein